MFNGPYPIFTIFRIDSDSLDSVYVLTSSRRDAEEKCKEHKARANTSTVELSPSELSYSISSR